MLVLEPVLELTLVVVVMEADVVDDLETHVVHALLLVLLVQQIPQVCMWSDHLKFEHAGSAVDPQPPGPKVSG